MGDTYNNYGQAGAIGKNAFAFQNTFSQKDKENLGGLNEQDFTKLRELTNKLVAFDEKDFSKSEALRGAACLAEFTEASELKETEKQVEALGKWRLWLNGLKPTYLHFLAITADLVTVSLPLLKLLGLSTL